MVAMNPQTWDKDVAEIEPGGYLFYDSTKPLPPSRFRDDVTRLGVPLTAICNAEYTDARQRQLFKNIIYLGALSALLDIDAGEIEQAVRRAVQGQGGAARIQSQGAGDGARLRACELACPLPLRVARRDAGRPADLHRRQCRRGARRRLRRRDRRRVVSDHAFVVARRGFAKCCRKFRTDPETGERRFAILQAEDELASIGMVIGAAWNGARAFTATSGPGMSLMQEFLGLAYFAEIPACSSTSSAAVRRPACRRARSRRTCCPAPTRRMATPST